MRIPTSLTVPGHRRSVLIRRALAAVLVIAAALSAISSARDHPTTLIAAREIPAGHELQTEDITTARVPADVLPAASLGSDPAEAVGRVSVAAIGKGEILSSSRLLSTELVAELVGGGESHMIPVKLAEPDILPHLHHGDTVNVIAGSSTSTIATGAQRDRDAESAPQPSHTTIASGARVVAVGTPEEDARPDTVLLALAAESAEAVAAASLSQPLTVVIVGDRAHPDVESS